MELNVFHGHMQKFIRAERGSVLIASLWAVSALTVFVSSVAFQAGQQAVLLKREQSAFQARIDFTNALNLAAKQILEDEVPEADSMEDEWFGDISLPEPWKNTISVHVSVESSRIDINKASETLLKNLFQTVAEADGQFKGKGSDFAEEILKMRADKKIASIEELFLAEEIYPEDLEKLRPYITVYTEFSGIHINCAETLVLEAFIKTLPADEYAEADLIDAILEFRKAAQTDGISPFFTQAELDPYLFLSKLKLTPTVTMVFLVNQLAPYLTVDARIWRIDIDSATGRKAETVIRENYINQNFDTLTWREY